MSLFILQTYQFMANGCIFKYPVCSILKGAELMLSSEPYGGRIGQSVVWLVGGPSGQAVAMVSPFLTPAGLNSVLK